MLFYYTNALKENRVIGITKVGSLRIDKSFHFS